MFYSKLEYLKNTAIKKKTINFRDRKIRTKKIINLAERVLKIKFILLNCKMTVFEKVEISTSCHES